MTRSHLSRRFRAVHLLVVAAVAVTACIPPEGGLDLDDVAGHWLLDSGRVLGEPFPFVEGHRITLSLGGDGTLRGRSTCNSYAADYQLVAGIFDLGAELAATAMLCEPAVMAAEEALFRALPTLERAALDEGRLVLDSDDAVLAFTPLEVLDASLLEGEWAVTGYGEGNAAREIEGEPTLVFAPDGEVSGDTGCRPFTAALAVVGDEAFATEIETTAECGDGPTTQDEHILDVLGSGFVVEGSGDTVQFTAQGGRYLTATRH